MTRLRFPALIGLLALLAVTLGRTAPETQPAPAPYARAFPRKWVSNLVGRVTPIPDDLWRSPEGAPRPGDFGLAVSLWPGREIRGGEPVIARITVTNPQEQARSLPPLWFIHFVVRDAGGRSVGRVDDLPRYFPFDYMYSPDVIAAKGRVDFETVLNFWYDFLRGGRYSVEAQLMAMDMNAVPHKPDLVVVAAQKFEVTVVASERADWEGICSALWRPDPPTMQPSAEGDPAAAYTPSREAGRQALLYVTDEAALPYLWLLPKLGASKPDVVTALSNVKSPRAVALLRHYAANGTGAIAKQAAIELKRLGVAPQTPVVSSLPAAVPAKTLIRALAARPGLALVVAPAVAASATPVRVNPSAPLAQVAAALERSGFRAYVAAEEKAFVVLGPIGKATPTATSELALSSRLVALTTPAQLARRAKGYVMSPHLTGPQLDLVAKLSRLPKTTPRRTLSLGIWGTTGWDAAVNVRGRSLVHHATMGVIAYPVPAEVLPGSLGGSFLWWCWPPRVSPHVTDGRATIDPGEYTLLALEDRAPIRLAAPGVAGGNRRLFVAAKDAGAGYLAWALEIATGLKATPPEGGNRYWTMAPGNHVGPMTELLHFPAQGIPSCHQTPVGKAIISQRYGASAIWAPQVQAWPLQSLPPVIRESLLKNVPSPENGRLPGEPDYESPDELDEIVVLCGVGVHLEPGNCDPDKGGQVALFDLPAF